MRIVDKETEFLRTHKDCQKKHTHFFRLSHKNSVHLKDHMSMQINRMVSRTHLIVESDQVKGGFREVENEARFPFLREALQF